jgi:exocyst complex component 2
MIHHGGLQEQETRLLVTLAKFHHLRETSLPAILSSTSKLLDTDFSRDQSTLLEVVDNMDEMVFDDYIRRRSEKLVQVIEEGILHGGIDWLNASKPTGRWYPRFTELQPTDDQRSGHTCTRQSYRS